MVVIDSFEELVDHLKHSFTYKSQGDNNTRVAGLLFALPNNFTKDEILVGIDYFHNRSGKTIDFFCIGYQPVANGTDHQVITKVNGDNWYFNSAIFNHLREQISQVTTWKYTGSVELVLFNSYLDEPNGKVVLDFSDALSIDLRKAKDEKLISSVGEVFEDVISIAEGITTDNPTKEMSLKLIANTGKKSLVSVLFNLLPKGIQDETKKIYLFGTTDYNK